MRRTEFTVGQMSLFEPQDYTEAFDSIKEEPTRLTAMKQGKEVGFITYDTPMYPNSIDTVKVQTEHQGKGIGTILAQEALSRGKTWEYTLPISVGGRRLMARLGAQGRYFG